MLKKTKIIMLALILITSSISLLAFSGCNDNSLHRYWDMSLCETYSDRIIVHGLTRHGERYAEENDGVLNFPLEVDGRGMFLFRSGTAFPGGGTSWLRFNQISLVIFDENFQGSRLSFHALREDLITNQLRFSLQFNGRQNYFSRYDTRHFSVWILDSNPKPKVIFMRNSINDFYEEIMELYGTVPQLYKFYLDINS